MPTYKQKLVRDFYIKDKKVTKYLIYSTKFITYQEEKMVAVLIDDITEHEERYLLIKKLNVLKGKRFFWMCHRAGLTCWWKDRDT